MKSCNYFVTGRMLDVGIMKYQKKDNSIRHIVCLFCINFMAFFVVNLEVMIDISSSEFYGIEYCVAGTNLIFQ
jgi:inner membrane protein involved in colicin E2 resistance